MTHSGQGEERHPDTRPAREGVVLPADGSGPWTPGDADGRTAPASGQPWGEPWGPQSRQPAAPDHQDPYRSPELPPQGAQGEYRPQGGPTGQRPGSPYGTHSQPLPDEVPPGAVPYGAPGQSAYPHAPNAFDATQYIPPVQSAPGAVGSGDATAYLPPVQPGPQGAPARPGAGAEVPGSADRTQYIPSVSGAPVGGMDATQMIPPVQSAPGAVGSGDATAYLPPVQPGPQGAPDGTGAPGYLPPVAPGALPPESSAAPQGAVSPAGRPEPATQYLPPIPDAPTSAPYGIRPGAPGDRQPPAEFDNLFRNSAAAGAAARVPGAQGVPPQPPPPPQSRRRQGGQGPQRRSSFPVPVVATVVIVGCAVLGLGASALIFGGEDSGKPDAGPGTNAAASSPTPSTANSPKAASADPAERQAKALDSLLADSNDSRAVVIQSVANIRECKNLDQAATDLRGAADQRRGLVERLQKLTVDRLPKHGELTESLTDAWKASAAADDHYAAWAKQVKGKNGCRDGQARNTKRAGQGNRASCEATQAKQQAAGLWNPIAVSHGLTERRSEQL